jgi:RNA polymerase sigma-70 factor, ECF subfamily
MKLEQQQVEAARQGDIKAFGTLYGQYYATMVWLAYSILLDRHLAEDVAQQTFVKACENIASLRQTDRFGAWLSRICRNTAIQEDRQRRRLAAYQRQQTDSPESTEDDSLPQAIRAAIATLPPMYREIVVLHYYDQQSYERIESMLGITGHCVRGRLFRARKRIEAYLKQRGRLKDQSA